MELLQYYSLNLTRVQSFTNYYRVKESRNVLTRHSGLQDGSQIYPAEQLGEEFKLLADF